MRVQLDLGQILASAAKQFELDFLGLVADALDGVGADRFGIAFDQGRHQLRPDGVGAVDTEVGPAVQGRQLGRRRAGASALDAVEAVPGEPQGAQVLQLYGVAVLVVADELAAEDQV